MTACTSAASSPRTSRSCPWTLERPATVHLPALLAEAFGDLDLGGAAGPGPGRGPAGRRAGAGDVLDVPAGELDGRVLQLGKRRFARVEIAE